MLKLKLKLEIEQQKAIGDVDYNNLGGRMELQGHRVVVGSKKSMNIRREYSTCQATAIFMYITVIEP